VFMLYGQGEGSIRGQKTTNFCPEFLIFKKNSEACFFENSGVFEICYSFAPEFYKYLPFTQTQEDMKFVVFAPEFLSKRPFLGKFILFHIILKEGRARIKK
jgi:hypothetical protein